MPFKLAINSIIALAAAASVHAACEGGGCNVEALEDQVSLMQMQAKLHDSQLDAAVAEGKRELREYAHSIIGAAGTKDAVQGSDHAGKKMNISLGIPDGYYGTGGTKCFLSKKSVFTDPRAILKCSSINDIMAVERQNVNGRDCQKCLEDMRELNWWGGLLTSQRAKLIWGFSAHNQDQKGVQATQTCWACDGEWKKMCFNPLPAGATAPDSFSQQQPFMTKVAQHLQAHAHVNIYVDFLDDEMEKLIHKCGGRIDVFQEANYECFQDMMSLLKSRANAAHTFLHWYGASGPFCVAEQAGGTSGPHGRQAKPFVSQPVADMTAAFNGHQYKDQLCYSGMGPGQKPFLMNVCEACGGQNCDTICNFAK